jgi:hypothetical protein
MRTTSLLYPSLRRWCFPTLTLNFVAVLWRYCSTSSPYVRSLPVNHLTTQAVRPDGTLCAEISAGVSVYFRELKSFIGDCTCFATAAKDRFYRIIGNHVVRERHYKAKIQTSSCSLWFTRRYSHKGPWEKAFGKKKNRSKNYAACTGWKQVVASSLPEAWHCLKCRDRQSICWVEYCQHSGAYGAVCAYHPAMLLYALL